MFTLKDAEGARQVSPDPDFFSVSWARMKGRRAGDGASLRINLENCMTDVDIHTHIEGLVAEEHRLLDAASQGMASEADHTRLATVNVELDRYYDLLRQRRARAEFDQDPAAAHLRPEGTVETYLQ